MAIIKKEIPVEAKVGDIITTKSSIFRSDLTLYICFIVNDLLYISPEADCKKNDCETVFAEDCYLV
jgi:hypothetical protein